MEPETAPHAIVTNKIGNKYCPSTLKPLNAARLHDGLATNTPIIAPNNHKYKQVTVKVISWLK